MRGAESIAAVARCLAASGALAALACAAPRATPTPASLAERLRASATRDGGGALVVRLAFDAGADLDLYVTDPLEETAYFANTPTRAGGTLDADSTCADPGERVETVRFEAPPPGRYRVGVDHPASCGGAAPAPFAVRVEHGGRVWQTTGSVAPRRFEPIVLEISVDPPARVN
jgi:hypothetical protein